MKRPLTIVTIAILTLLFVYACSSTIRTANTSFVTITIEGNAGAATIQAEGATHWTRFKYFLADVKLMPEAQALIPTAVQVIIVTVSAPDMTTIVAVDDVSMKTTASILIEVPNGQARYFVVDAYDSSSALLYSGNTYAGLSGAPVTLNINMAYVVPKIFVANSADNTVSVIDAATDTVLVTVPVGTSPYGVAINSVTNRAYIANFGGSDVSVIDVTTNTVINTVPIALSTPYGIAVNSNNNRIYITDKWNSTDVYYINGADNTTGTLAAIGNTYSHGIAVNPNTNIAYIADWGWAYKIDTITNIVIGSAILISGSNESAFGVAIDPSTNITIVTDTGGDLNFIDAADTVTTVIAAGTSLEGVAIDPSTHLAYIADSGANSVLVVDIASQSIVTTIPVGLAPKGVAFYAAVKKVYVANSGTNTVSVIDTTNNTVINTITVGASPLGIAVNR